jgi:Rrf2 family transcriptional regulator, cysteine metabolism repressor
LNTFGKQLSSYTISRRYALLAESKMKLSRTIVYAIQATVALSEMGRNAPISCRQIADGRKMPERFLLQVLRNLVSHGVLESATGVMGGYYLARPPHKITLLEIMDAFDNPLSTPWVPELPEIMPITHERLVTCFAESTRAARQSLARFTIADLAQLPTNSSDVSVAAKTPNKDIGLRIEPISV